jgi:DNA-damage-inducible protein D
VVEKDLKGQQKIGNEHIENNLAVRKILKERGVQPEKLPALEDVKKVQRRLESEEKKVGKNTEKLNKK